MAVLLLRSYTGDHIDETIVNDITKELKILNDRIQNTPMSLHVTFYCGIESESSIERAVRSVYIKFIEKKYSDYFRIFGPARVIESTNNILNFSKHNIISILINNNTYKYFTESERNENEIIKTLLKNMEKNNEKISIVDFSLSLNTVFPNELDRFYSNLCHTDIYTYIKKSYMYTIYNLYELISYIKCGVCI